MNAMLRAAIVLAVVVAIFFAVSVPGCDGCGARGRLHEIGMCGKCVWSSDCRVGLECVNETCETVPPSCHVEIGL
jgi:hypothetical protein